MDIKAMIDFFQRSFCKFLLLISLHSSVVDLLKVQWPVPLQLLIFSEAKRMNVRVRGQWLQGVSQGQRWFA